MPWLSLVCQRLIAEASLAIGTYRQRSGAERVLAVAVGAVQQQNQGVKDAPEMLLSSLGQSEVLLSPLRPFLQSAPGSVGSEHAASPAALILTGV